MNLSNHRLRIRAAIKNIRFYRAYLEGPQWKPGTANYDYAAMRGCADYHDSAWTTLRHHLPLRNAS